MLEYCRYTDAGADETVALIGDSHALSAYWGVAKLGREVGYNTVLLGWVIPAGEMWNAKLAAQAPAIFEVLKKKSDIRKVFICTRGMLYITGTRLIAGEASPADLENADRRPTGYEPFKHSLQSYIDTLREYGKEVFIISEVPELPGNPRDYIGRPLRPAKKGGIPEAHRADVLQRQAPYLQLLSEIRDATVIDTIGPMCPGGTCLVFTENGLPLYYDDHHLTPIGSEFQAERSLRPYLATGRSGQYAP
jgi:hypothetical protein